MPSILADLVVNLIGNDSELIAASARSAAALEKTAASAATNGGKINDFFKKAGGVAAGALVAIAGVSAKMASDFNAQMMLIRTQAGDTTTSIADLSNQVLALAPTVGQSPQQLAEGLFHIESAGLRGQAAMDALTASAKLSAIGMSSMEDTANALVGVMVTAPTDIKSASDAAAILNTTVGIGNMKMQDLVGALGTGALPAFKSAGLGMKDFSASLALLTDMGEPAEQAATRLRTSISMMTAPSQKAEAALASIGLSGKKLAEDMSQPGGLMVAVNDLKTHLSGLDQVAQNQVLEKAFGGAKSSATVEALVQNTGRLQQKYQQLGDASTRAAQSQKAWSDTQATAKQQMHELTAGIEAMGIKLGSILLPVITKFVEFLNGHKAVMEAFFGSLLVFLGLLTIAWIAEGVATIAATWPILLIIAAIALLALGIFELWKHWSDVWGWIKRVTEDVWNWMKATGDDWWRHIKGFFDAIWTQGIKPIWDFLTAFGKAWASIWSAIGNALVWVYDHTLKPIFDAIGKALGTVSSLVSSVSKVGSTIGHIFGFAEGGMVPGPVGAPQLAIVHGGEYVLNTDQVSAIRGATVTAVVGAATGGGGAGNQVIENHLHLYIDGKELRNTTIREAQRYKNRNSSTGLT